MRSPRPTDAAALGAALLFRIGFGLLVVALPPLAVVSRRAVVVVAPIGAALLLLASALMVETPDPRRRLLPALLSPLGIAIALLVLWSFLSLLWSPFAADGLERLARIAGTLLLTLLAVLALPSRMRTSNLYLLPIGTGLGTLLALGVVLAGQGDREGITTERAVILLVMLGWPAVAWLSIRRHAVSAMALAGGLGALVLLQGSGTIAAALLAGAVVLGGAVANRRATAEALGWGALAVLVAPLVALGLARLVAPELPLGAAARIWADVMVSDPQRLLTGHGVETAIRNRIAATLDAGAPRGLAFELWYELGLLGAVFGAVALRAMARSLGALREPLAGFALGAFVFALVLGLLGQGLSQTWWLIGIAVAALAFAAVAQGAARERRQRARLPEPVTRGTLPPSPQDPGSAGQAVARAGARTPQNSDP